MTNNKQRLYIKIMAGIALVISVPNLFLFIFAKYPNFDYQPYVAKHLSLVFDDQRGNESDLGKLDFLLTDVKKLQLNGKKVGIVGSSPINESKRLDLLIPKANDIYIDIFSDEVFNQNNTAEFQNIYNLSLPFVIKSYLSEDNELKVVYQPPERKISFLFTGQDLQINEHFFKLNDLEIFSIENVSPDVLLKIGDLKIDLAAYENSFTVLINNLVSNGVEIYQPKRVNIFARDNYSFEKGLWSNEVGDCSAYLAGQPKLDMRLSSDASNGLRSLQISSDNHFACTFKSFGVELTNDQLYQLSFDYKNVEGQTVQFYYNLTNELGQIQENFESFDAVNNNWNNHKIIINPTIEKINNIDLYFYAPSDGTKKIVNLYDDIQLKAFELDKKITLNNLEFPTNYSLANYIKLKHGKNIFKYLNTKQNLLAEYNYSFEQGLWQDEAVDCSDYLGGLPKLDIKLSNDATNGNKSLELISENHFACTFGSFPLELEGDKLYKLSFDYKNIAGDTIQYYYNFKNDIGQSQNKFETFSVADNNWHTFEIIVNPGLENINNFEIYFYAPSDGSEKIHNLYDNIKLEEFAPKEIYTYYLFSMQAVRPVRLDSLSSRTINAFKSKVILEGITDSLLLIYPREYDSRWKIYPYPKDLGNNINRNPSIFTTFLNDPIAEDLHLEADNYANSWLININDLCHDRDLCQQNQDGSFNITLIIEHNFNKAINLSLIIFGSIFGLASLYLLNSNDSSTSIRFSSRKTFKTRRTKNKTNKNSTWLTMINVAIISGYLMLFGIELPNSKNYGRFITLAIILLIFNVISLMDMSNKDDN